MQGLSSVRSDSSHQHSLGEAMMSPRALRSRYDGSCPEPAMGTGKSNSSTEHVARCACIGAPGLIFLTERGANRDASPTLCKADGSSGLHRSTY